MKAVVLQEDPQEKLVVKDVELRDLKEGEVLVKNEKLLL